MSSGIHRRLLYPCVILEACKLWYQSGNIFTPLFALFVSPSMSTPQQHTKRTRNTTADIEANKRQRLSPEAERQARKTIIDARRHRAQNTPNQPTPETGKISSYTIASPTTHTDSNVKQTSLSTTTTRICCSRSKKKQSDTSLKSGRQFVVSMPSVLVRQHGNRGLGARRGLRLGLIRLWRRLQVIEHL